MTTLTETAVHKEAAWLSADPGVLEHFPRGVEPYVRRRVANARAAHLWRPVPLVEYRLDQGQKVRRHDFAVSVHWPVPSGAAKPEDEQARLDLAVDALVERIRSSSDPTHGGLFISVGEEEGAGGNEIRAELLSDPNMLLGTAGARGDVQPVLRVDVRYSATDVFVSHP